jgi:hypothetical protein
MNQFFVVSREVFDETIDQVVTSPDYSVFGLLLVIVALISRAVPIVTVYMSQKSPL